MKTITIFEVQKINQYLDDQEIPYTLKLSDACGNPSYRLEKKTDKELPAQEICSHINQFLINHHKQVKPGTINPYNILVF